MAYCITSVITIAVGYYVMADYFVEVYPEAYLKIQVHYDRYVVQKGNGYFASVFPNYITNIDGVYNLSVSNGATLVISYVGLEKQEKKVGNEKIY